MVSGVVAALLLVSLRGGEAIWSSENVNNEQQKMMLSTTNSSNLEKTQSRKGLLILKQARTASTYFVEQLNTKDFHVSQESLLGWESWIGNNKTKEDYKDYFTTDATMAWVEESFNRPMPKNPFAFTHECSLISGMKFVKASRSWSQKKLNMCEQRAGKECAPPFKDEDSCMDTYGCFQMSRGQAECYHEDKAADVYGISFNYNSDFHQGADGPDLDHIISKVIERVRGTGDVELKVLAQSRSNVVRFAISKGFGDPGKASHDLKKLKIDRPERLLLTVMQKVADIVQHVRNQAGGDSHIMFYEDVVRDTNQAINQMSHEMYNYPMVSEMFAPKGVDRNTYDQHANPVEDYIENIDEVREKMKDYPCIYRQLFHKSKYDTFKLPMRLEKDGSVTVDYHADCCIIKSDEHIRTIDEYLAYSC